MSSLFDIGLSGLRASKYAMYLTANNIANANNPFYARREVDFMERTQGKFGSGVGVGDLRRISDKLIEEQLLAAKSACSKSSMIYDSLKGFEKFIDNDESNISQFIDASAAALESLNATPTSSQGRNFYLDQLKNLSHRINDISYRLSDETSQAKKAFTEEVGAVNALLQHLADINGKIKVAQPDDKTVFEDAQEKLLNQLSELLYVHKERDEYGAIELHLANGMPLLQGNYLATLVAVNADDSGRSFSLGIQSSTQVIPIDASTSGGKLGALIDYTSGRLNHLQHKLDRLSVALALNMNKQNKLGINAQGLLGGNLFNDPNALDFAQNKTEAYRLNQGSGTFLVNITDTQKLTDSDYRLNFDSASHYTLVRQSDGELLGDGNVNAFPFTLAADGFSLEISAGVFYAGDSYSIHPTKGAADQLKMICKNGAALALGFPVVTAASIQNKGSGQINLSDITDTSKAAFSIPGQLNPPLKVEFLSATTYRLVNAKDNSIIEDNISYDPNQTQEIIPSPGGYDPGYRVSLTGLIEAGDSFAINYNVNGAGDNRNGLLMSTLYKAALVGPEGLSFSQSYQDLTFELASAVNSAKVNFDADEILKNQAQSGRDQMSGVSLEEETMNLTRMQESYMANAQILEAVKQTMDALFAIFRR